MHEMHVACRILVHHHAPFFFNHPTSIKWFVSWTVRNRLLKPLCGKMLDWLNFHLGEITGLMHVLEKRYYQNKTLLRYNFGSVYLRDDKTEKMQSGAQFCKIDLIKAMQISIKIWGCRETCLHEIASPDFFTNQYSVFNKLKKDQHTCLCLRFFCHWNYRGCGVGTKLHLRASSSVYHPWLGQIKGMGSHSYFKVKWNRHLSNEFRLKNVLQINSTIIRSAKII